MDAVTREVFAGVPLAGKVIFYLLAALSLGWAGVGCWRRVRLWRPGHPADLGPWGARLRQWATFGLGQQRLPRRRFAGVIHRLTFSGFLVLGLGTLLLALDYATPLNFHHGAYYRIYELVLDLFGLAFVVGSGLIVYRRLFHAPPSLSTCPNEFRMLVLLAAIGVTGFLLEGLRILAEQTPPEVAAWSPIGYGISRLLAVERHGIRSLPTPVAAPVHLVVWWLHAGLALTLLALFPWRRTSHALASFVHLLVRPVRHPGALAPSGNSEIRQSGNWAIRKLGNPEIGQPENSDRASQFPSFPVSQFPSFPVSQFPSFPFSWPQLIGLDACMACGRCNDVCPAKTAAEPLKPKELVQGLRKWMSHGHGASPFGELVTHQFP
jgi:nitrate reductase gamma subunit